MVAYSFKRRFCDDVAEGRKRQTIRGERARHARPGERVQLFFGMRTRQCRKLRADPLCTAVVPVWIVVKEGGTASVSVDDGPMQPVSTEFAQADGFADPDDFTRFWRETHGVGSFVGVLIRWDPDA